MKITTKPTGNGAVNVLDLWVDDAQICIAALMGLKWCRSPYPSGAISVRWTTSKLRGGPWYVNLFATDLNAIAAAEKELWPDMYCCVTQSRPRGKPMTLCNNWVVHNNYADTLINEGSECHNRLYALLYAIVHDHEVKTGEPLEVEL